MDIMRNELLSNIKDAIPSLSAEDFQTLTFVVDKTLAGYDCTIKPTELITTTDANESVLKWYIIDCKMRGLSASTISLYKTVIGKMTSTIGKSITGISSGDMRVYIAEMLTGGKIKKRSIELYRQILSGFFDWAVKNNIIQTNPMTGIEAIKYEKTRPKIMSRQDLETIRSHCSELREKAIIEFMCSTWCRISELCNVKLSDINWQSNTVTLNGKGSVQRIGFMNARCVVTIKNYLAHRGSNSEHLFCSKVGNKENVTTSAIRKVLKQTYEHIPAGDIVFTPTPHSYRRTSATNAVASGMSIQVAQKILGHKQIGTTMIYVQTGDGIVRSEYDRFNN